MRYIVLLWAAVSVSALWLGYSAHRRLDDLEVLSMGRTRTEIERSFGPATRCYDGVVDESHPGTECLYTRGGDLSLFEKPVVVLYRGAEAVASYYPDKPRDQNFRERFQRR
jgi:hypothetical protein